MTDIGVTGSVADRPASTPAAPGITGLHHVQLAGPSGSEAALRAFYVGVLGMTELDKPPVLAARGGAWFRAGSAELHLGVEEPFHAARKAHPGLVVSDIDHCAAVLELAGAAVEWDPNFPGHRRFYTADPCGNRIEILQPLQGPTGTG